MLREEWRWRERRILLTERNKREREVLETAAAQQKHVTQHPRSVKELPTKPTGNFTI